MKRFTGLSIDRFSAGRPSFPVSDQVDESQNNDEREIRTGDQGHQLFERRKKGKDGNPVSRGLGIDREIRQDTGVFDPIETDVRDGDGRGEDREYVSRHTLALDQPEEGEYDESHKKRVNDINARAEHVVPDPGFSESVEQFIDFRVSVPEPGIEI